MSAVGVLLAALAAAAILAAFVGGFPSWGGGPSRRESGPSTAAASPRKPDKTYGNTHGKIPGPDTPYAAIQETIESALVTVLSLRAPSQSPAVPRQDAGRTDPAVPPADWALGGQDWPAPALGQAAAIRCRLVEVPPERTFAAVQAEIVGALARLGMGALWHERLPGGDFLRLDVGAPRRPTHTLVLHRPGCAEQVFFSEEPARTAWEMLAEGAAPTIALVIDDWGHGINEATSRILDLPIPLTLSVLPDLPFSRHFAAQGTDILRPAGLGPTEDAAAGAPRPAPAEAAKSRAARLAAGCPVPVVVGPAVGRPLPRRREIILHLPMQPDGFPDDDPGPGAILVGMDSQAIAGLIDRARLGLPMITGVNNHMGSAATRDAATMAALMPVLRDRGLLFLDSMTTPESVAYGAAQAAGLVALRNRLFLDTDSEDPQRIADNLTALVEAARATGFVVGIGHPHPQTAEVLAREIPRLRQQGLRFVTLSELAGLRREGAAP